MKGGLRHHPAVDLARFKSKLFCAWSF